MQSIPIQEGENSTTEPAQQSGYCIEIHVSADNQITVGVEPESAESAEGETQPDNGGQAVSSIREALQVAMDIFKNGGQVMDAESGDGDFSAGFASGPKMPEGPAKRFA
jgi:hypothetical protein